MTRHLAVALLLSTAACNSKAPTEPRLELEPAQRDFGEVALGDPVNATFLIRNTGRAPLEIRGAVPALGCTGSAAPARLAPSEAGELRVQCRPQATGPLSVSLRIQSNAPSAPEVLLSGNVVPHIGFERPYLSLRIPFGEERREEVALVGDRVRDARPVLSNFELPACKSELVRDERGLRLRLACRGAKVGLSSDVLKLQTGLAEPAELTLPCSVDVIGTLRISPTNPYFNMRLPGPKTVVIDVQSSRPEFRVSHAEVREGPFAATLRGSGGRFEVVVTVDEARWNGDERGAIGVLRIYSNDSSEPEKDVPLSAFGKQLRESG